MSAEVGTIVYKGMTYPATRLDGVVFWGIDRERLAGKTLSKTFSPDWPATEEETGLAESRAKVSYFPSTLSTAQRTRAEQIRWRLGQDNGEYVTGWCVYRGQERKAIRFTSSLEAGETYVWVNETWHRTGPTVRDRFRRGASS